MGAISYPKFKAFDQDGQPLAGGLLYSYAPGTLTPKSLYSDITLSTPLTNPVQLDSYGEAEFYGNGLYKFVLTDATGLTTILTIDNVQGSDGIDTLPTAILYPYRNLQITPYATPPGGTGPYLKITANAAMLQAAASNTVLGFTSISLTPTANNLGRGGLDAGNLSANSQPWYCYLISDGANISSVLSLSSTWAGVDKTHLANYTQFYSCIGVATNANATTWYPFCKVDSDVLFDAAISLGTSNLSNSANYVWTQANLSNYVGVAATQAEFVIAASNATLVCGVGQANDANYIQATFTSTNPLLGIRVRSRMDATGLVWVGVANTSNTSVTPYLTGYKSKF